MTNKRILAICASILSATILSAEDMAIKEAFDMGMKSAIKVMNYERKQAFEPIKKGYCIEVKTVDSQETDDFSAIKLESLSLYMGMKPSFIELSSGNGVKEKKLCFAMTEKSKAHAESILKQIREEHPKIDSFYPSIIQIANPKAYARIVPSIGEIYADKSDTINDLAKNIEQTNQKYEEILRVERQKISELEEKLSAISNLAGGSSEITHDANDIKNDANSVKQEIVREANAMKNQAGKKRKKIDEDIEKAKKEVGEAADKNSDKLKEKLDKLKSAKYPIITQKENNIRYKDVNKNLTVNIEDRENPRILTVNNTNN